MQSETPPQRTRDPQKVLMAILIAGIVLSVGVVAYVVYTGAGSSHAQSSRAIAAGDSVELNYIGTLPDGRVFDTSRGDVANNNILFPKSLTFTHRDNSSYTPFTMTAGNYGSGGTIKGFALGVIGMHVNDTKTIEVPPEDGYAVNVSMMSTKHLVEELAATETFPIQDFRDQFGVEPILWETVKHFFWGWDVVVVGNSSELITIKFAPTVGQIVHPFSNPNDPSDQAGWPVLVEAFDPSASYGVGKVVIRHQLTSADVYNIKGYDEKGMEFIVSGFNGTDGTFQVHKVDTSTGYNGEITGRTLFFEVTIVKITPAQS